MKSFFVKYVFLKKKKTSFFPEIFNVIIKTTCSRNKGARVSHRTVIIVGRGGGWSPYGRGSIVLRWGQVFVVGVFREALKFQCICASYFTYWHWSGLNISTGHRTMAGKKSSYFLRKLLHIGHICAALSFFLSYWRLKTHRHLVSMFLFYSDFSLYEHFIRQMTYAVVLY